jgi:type II secretory pathway component GspD/PulD (secretin)
MDRTFIGREDVIVFSARKPLENSLQPNCFSAVYNGGGGVLNSPNTHGKIGLCMKTQLLMGLLLTLTLVTACNKRSGSVPEPAPKPKTFSSFDVGSDTATAFPPHAIRFVEADAGQVLAFYQELSGRSLIRSPRVPMTTKITFDNQTSLTRTEALQALDNVLSANGIVMVYFGTQYVKVIAPSEVISETGPVIELPPDRLPESSSFLLYLVKLKHIRPEDAVPLLVPYAKLPNGIIGMRDSNVLTLRDYSANVRRMLQVLDEIDQGPGFKKTAEQIFKPATGANPPRRP